MAYVTAYGGLVDLAGLGHGDVVVIPAASSGVGLAAIQIANMVGATPVALTRTNTKRQQLRDAGASAVIVTETEDVRASLDQVSGGTGVRVIFDPVGGPLLTDLLGAAASYATVIIYGALAKTAVAATAGFHATEHCGASPPRAASQECRLSSEATLRAASGVAPARASQEQPRSAREVQFPGQSVVRSRNRLRLGRRVGSEWLPFEFDGPSPQVSEKPGGTATRSSR